jgi:hypothetical protein
MSLRPTRRSVLALAAGVAAANSARAQRRLVLNDASRLSATPLVSHWVARAESEGVVIARLRRELAEAARTRRPFAVSAARHSMGAQSLPRDGRAATLDGARPGLRRGASLSPRSDGTVTPEPSCVVGTDGAAWLRVRASRALPPLASGLLRRGGRLRRMPTRRCTRGGSSSKSALRAPSGALGRAGR